MNDDLVRRMVAASELHGDFVLSSGQRSSVYFDKFRFLTEPSLLRDVAKATASLLPPAVALETGPPVTVVRKQPKEYGTKAQVEGVVEAGARIALIEDVSTTGHQVRRAAEILEAAGAEIVTIVLAIDRGGADHLREAGYAVGAVAVLRPDA